MSKHREEIQQQPDGQLAYHRSNLTDLKKQVD